MRVYLLLMIAACWHALGIGTQGHRGRIVHTITGAGMLWGALTPPWGWVQIGGAVATVMGGRWLVTPDGRAFLVALGRVLVEAADMVLCTLGRTLRWVLSPVEREAPPVERERVVSIPRDTLGSALALQPPRHLFEPEPWQGRTAQQDRPTPAAAPVETYADVLGSVLAGTRGFNEGARYVAEHHKVSRSKFAVDMRRLREEAA